MFHKTATGPIPTAHTSIWPYLRPVPNPVPGPVYSQRLLRRQTPVSRQWIADRLHIGSASCVSYLVKQQPRAMNDCRLLEPLFDLAREARSASSTATSRLAKAVTSHRTPRVRAMLVFGVRRLVGAFGVGRLVAQPGRVQRPALGERGASLQVRRRQVACAKAVTSHRTPDQ